MAGHNVVLSNTYSDFVNDHTEKKLQLIFLIFLSIINHKRTRKR